jgi:hypothetical protein
MSSWLRTSSHSDTQCPKPNLEDVAWALPRTEFHDLGFGKRECSGPSDFRGPPETKLTCRCKDLAQIVSILDLLAEDSRLNVYAGELDLRPPGAPTTGAVMGEQRGLVVARPLATTRSSPAADLSQMTGYLASNTHYNVR